MRQLIFVITLLLIEKRNATIYCVRTIMNFVTFAQYISYNENIFSYIKYSLYQFNRLKIVFFKYQFKNKINDFKNENKKFLIIFKLYVIIYYVVFIRLYNNV